MARTLPKVPIPRTRSAREQFWLDHLRALGEQDQPLSAYAETHGLSPGSLYRARARLAQTARTCIYGHLEERNTHRLRTSSLRRRLRLTLDDRVRPPHHPADNPVVSVQRA